MVFKREQVQPFEAISLEEHDDHRVTYGLRHQPSGETAENVELTVTPYGGPGRQNTTYFGTYRSSDPEQSVEYEVLYVGNPTIWVIVLIAAAVCAGIIVIGELAHDCATECAHTCGGAGGVKRCEAKVTYGFGWEDGSFDLGCHHECSVECYE